MKRLMLLAALMLGFVLCVNACTANKANKQETNSTENMKILANESHESLLSNGRMQQNLSKDKKILVAYFSWSGNTKDAALYIANKLGAHTFEIERQKPYPTEYQPCTEDAKAEKEAGERPAIKGKVANMDQYDVVFVGVPVWWYTAPMPVFTFLEQYDFKGKTVIPFCTCYTAEYNTLKDIVKETPAANHADGLTIVTHDMGGNGMDKKHAQIDNWLKSIGF